jgi:hypothetical protein
MNFCHEFFPEFFLEFFLLFHKSIGAFITLNLASNKIMQNTKQQNIPKAQNRRISFSLFNFLNQFMLLEMEL